jgi:hypothetical protein
MGDDLSGDKSLARLTGKSGGAYGTIFATFSSHHRQKCSVSCNRCERRSNPQESVAQSLVD